MKSTSSTQKGYLAPPVTCEWCHGFGFIETKHSYVCRSCGATFAKRTSVVLPQRKPVSASGKSKAGRAMNKVEKRALEYVRNTNGGATLEIFCDDHEPIGPNLWRNLRDSGWAFVDENSKMRLTKLGKQKLGETKL